jgi:hypothetical protein
MDAVEAYMRTNGTARPQQYWDVDVRAILDVYAPEFHFVTRLVTKPEEGILIYPTTPGNARRPVAYVRLDGETVDPWIEVLTVRETLEEYTFPKELPECVPVRMRELLRHLRVDSSCSCCTRVVYGLQECVCGIRRYCDDACRERDRADHIDCPRLLRRRYRRDYERVVDRRYPNLSPLAPPSTPRRLPVPVECDRPTWLLCRRQDAHTTSLLLELPSDLLRLVGYALDCPSLLMCSLACWTTWARLKRCRTFQRIPPRIEFISSAMVRHRHGAYLRLWASWGRSVDTSFSYAVDSNDLEAFTFALDTLGYDEEALSCTVRAAWEGKVQLVELVVRRYLLGREDVASVTALQRVVGAARLSSKGRCVLERLRLLGCAG